MLDYQRIKRKKYFSKKVFNNKKSCTFACLNNSKLLIKKY
jgi:hypothetical protein